MLKHAAKKVFNLIFDRPLPPPLTTELHHIAELTETFRALPVEDVRGAPPSLASWLRNVNQLRKLVLGTSPREFLRWDVVVNSMFVSSPPYVLRELVHLRRNPAWKPRWRDAIRESPAGHPMPCPFLPTSSGNLIHHAYHVARFEAETGCEVARIGRVFEFGGGYGSMCRLFFRLGFKGEYTILDLPPFSALQRYYLQTLGLSVRALGASDAQGTGILCESDLGRLALRFDGVPAGGSLFLATWSLSETPLELRRAVLNMVDRFDFFLIAYQDRFGEVDNREFFKQWREAIDGVVWHERNIGHMPGNAYLFGRQGGA